MKTSAIHYFSGIIISCFIGIHLTNHFVSIISPEKHITVMRAFRHVYRNQLLETILLASVVVQIISGFRLYKRSKKNATTFFDKLHIWSGLYMAFFLVIHVSAVLTGRMVLHLDTNFYFGVAGINSFPFNLFFIPYYAFAILAFFGHIAAIHYKKMKASFLGLTVKQQANILLFLGVLFTLLIFYGLTNHFNGVIIPAEYRVLLGE